MKASRFNLALPSGWFSIALADELEVNDVKALFFFERDLVLFRTHSGEAKLIDAICPHLGAHLGHGGSVIGDSIACPFHGWQFNGDGVCTKVPYAKRMPGKVDGKQATTAYPVVERNNAIWAWFHPNGKPPQYEIDAIEAFESEHWSKPKVHEWIINAPIQETGENAVDQAHFAYVHTSPSVPLGEVSIDGPIRVTKMESLAPAFDDDGNIIEGEMRPANLLSKNIGPGFSLQHFTGMFETYCLAMPTPITADKMLVRFMFTHPREISEIKTMLAQGYTDEVCNQIEQDINIWEHKHYLPNPILCDGDGPINQYRKWFSQFYE